MQEILFNLALIDTTRFCIEHNIDCSGSHLIKAPRGYSYSLIKTETGKTLVTVKFYKNSVPSHQIY